MSTKKPSVRLALAKSLKARPASPGDEATVALARRLAIQIDEADDVATVERLTPKLLTVLTALQLTPAARSAATSREVTSKPVRKPDIPQEGSVAHVGRDLIAEQRARYGPAR